MPAGHRNRLSKDKLRFVFFTSPAGGGQNSIKDKPPCPQGTETTSRRRNPAFFFLMISLRKCRCHYAPCSSSDMQLPQLPPSQPDALPLSFRARADAGIARRGGRSPSAARKLPQRQPRSPRKMSEKGKLQRGASGGMQGGPRRGRSPITGPALPPPEAAQTTENESLRARRAQKPHLKGQARFYPFRNIHHASSPQPRTPPQALPLPARILQSKLCRYSGKESAP